MINANGIIFSPPSTATVKQPEPVAAEPVVADAAAAPVAAATKKRSRKPAAPAVGSGVVVCGDRFVCSYSGQIRERAIFIPDVPTAAFANLPCAFAWLSLNVRDAATLAECKDKLCKEYQQPNPEAVPLPLPRDNLIDFGGNMTYSEWAHNLVFWDTHATTAGISVAEWKKMGKSKGPVKRGKGAQSRVSFDTGVYSVGVGSAGKTKKVDGVDNNDKEDKSFTAIKALRKLDKFARSHEDMQLAYQMCNGAGYSAVVLVPKQPQAETKFLNHITSQLTECQCYGPAVVFALRKLSVKV